MPLNLTCDSVNLSSWINWVPPPPFALSAAILMVYLSHLHSYWFASIFDCYIFFALFFLLILFFPLSVIYKLFDAFLCICIYCVLVYCQIIFTHYMLYTVRYSQMTYHNFLWPEHLLFPAKYENFSFIYLPLPSLHTIKWVRWHHISYASCHL